MDWLATLGSLGAVLALVGVARLLGLGQAPTTEGKCACGAVHGARDT